MQAFLEYGNLTNIRQNWICSLKFTQVCKWTYLCANFYENIKIDRYIYT